MTNDQTMINGPMTNGLLCLGYIFESWVIENSLGISAGTLVISRLFARDQLAARRDPPRDELAQFGNFGLGQQFDAATWISGD